MNVLYRKDGAAGLKTETLSTKKMKTVRELKGHVLKVLNSYVEDIATVKVKLCDLRVFLKRDSQWTEIPDGDIPLIGGDTYVVYEYYSNLPMDMFRTVTTEQLVPAVYTHPDKVSSFTKMSPIYCCSFTKPEQNESFEWKSNRNYPKVNGVSLQCRDDDVIAHDGDFSDSSLEALKEGNHSVSLETLQSRLPSEEIDRNNSSGNSDFSEMGITLNSLTTTPVEVDVPIYIFLSKWEESQMKTNNGNLRRFFYRYVLKAGTDLKPHGMAVVRDNTSRGHCSLITDRNFPRGNDWIYTGPGQKILWPTIPSENVRDNQEWHQLEEAWQQNVPVPLKFRYITPAGKYHMAHPYVASHFALHDFRIIASAKPLPLSSFEGEDDQHLWYKVAIVLFDNDCYQDERHAVDVLVKCLYDITVIPEDDLQVLISSIDSILDVWNNKHDDDYDVDDFETLQQAVRVLNLAELPVDFEEMRLPEENNASVPATNQMPTTPKKRPTKKPKTTRGPPRVLAKVLNVPDIETVLTDKTTPPSSDEKTEDEPSSDVPSMKVISGSSH